MLARKEMKLTEGPLFRQIVLFSLPLVLSNLLQVLKLFVFVCVAQADKVNRDLMLQLVHLVHTETGRRLFLHLGPELVNKVELCLVSVERGQKKHLLCGLHTVRQLIEYNRFQ